MSPVVLLSSSHERLARPARFFRNLNGRLLYSVLNHRLDLLTLCYERPKPHEELRDARSACAQSQPPPYLARLLRWARRLYRGAAPRHPGGFVGARRAGGGGHGFGQDRGSRGAACGAPRVGSARGRLAALVYLPDAGAGARSLRAPGPALEGHGHLIGDEERRYRSGFTPPPAGRAYHYPRIDRLAPHARAAPHVHLGGRRPGRNPPLRPQRARRPLALSITAHRSDPLLRRAGARTGPARGPFRHGGGAGRRR